MIAAAALLAYATALCLAAPRLMSHGRWWQRAPRLAVAAWQAITLSLVAAAALAGLALAVPTVPVSTDIAALLRACAMALRAHYATPGGAAAATAGAVLAIAVLARVGYGVGATLAAATRGRSRHRAILALVGQHQPGLDVVVLEVDVPAIYCIPGRCARIVVTRGALAHLDDAQLAAALAHERAHVAQRHHLVLAWSGGLVRAFPRVGLFVRAHRDTQRLVELLADDAAARQSGRLSVADALLALAGAPTPANALGAGGGAETRIRRLLEPPDRLGRVRVAASSAGVALALAAPLLLAAGPALAAIGMEYCPMPASQMPHN